MPSPFPGMDPYLEHPEVWPGVHARLVTESAALLQPRLRARGYYVDIGERIWLARPQRPIYPDLALARPARPRVPRETIAVAEPDEPVRIARAEVQVREPYLVIYRAEGAEVVTGIEVLSPTNKLDRQGRALYEQKQAETREAGVHLVEIDLLRDGPRVVEFPDVLLEELPRHDYLVNVARRGGEDYEIYPVRIRDRLPRIRVPLKAGEEDEVLDLQAALDRAYDQGPYPERLDDARPPTPPLADDDAARGRGVAAHPRRAPLMTASPAVFDRSGRFEERTVLSRLENWHVGFIEGLLRSFSRHTISINLERKKRWPKNFASACSAAVSWAGRIRTPGFR